MPPLHAARSPFPFPAARLWSLVTRTLMMGVINLTSDSFSDGGLASDPARAIDAVRAMEAAGADIIDIGGESTRPGADAAQRGRRMAPAAAGAARGSVAAFGCRCPSTPTKAEVANCALDEGVAIVNDVSGLGYDPLIGTAACRPRRARRADAHARPADATCTGSPL